MSRLCSTRAEAVLKRYILENLNLGEGLPARGGLATVAPLCMAGAPEAPARVFVWVP